MKNKNLLLSAIFLSLFSPIVIWAASFSYTPMEQIPGTATNSGDFYVYIQAVYNFGIWAVGISALLMITIGGYMYISSAANVASVDKAKGVIADAIIGLILALTAYLLLWVINPNLVRLDKGDVASKATQSTATTDSTTATTDSTTATTTGATCTNAATNLTDICSGSCQTTCPESTFSPYTAFIAANVTANISEKLLKSIICHESSGDPTATSDVGACGLMQVMPNGSSCETDSRGNLLDPETNIAVGSQVFADKLSAVSSLNYPSVTNIEMAAASYNCCANGSNPNAKSVDCASDNIPAWACPTNPGTDTSSNMCTVKTYACDVALCAI